MPRELKHTGRKIKVYLDVTTAPDGSTITRDVIIHPGAVVILPIVDAEHVSLLRNQRWVVDELLWEIPAGTLEPGEPIEDAAKRELLEETGYTADRWRYLGFLYASPGVLNEKLHLYIAEGLTAGTARPEADEELEAVTVPLTDALAMCLDGRIKDAKTITALLLWDRLRGRD
ncbi:MAG: NUDIX hydrolase [Fimbriiglobus sp.]